MGKFQDWYFGKPPMPEPLLVETKPRHRFAIGDDYETWRALIGPYSTGRVTRAEAMQVPAIKSARDTFATLGTLPIHCLNGAKEEVSRQLLIQPERGYTRSKTMADIIDDLFFESVSLCQVQTRDYAGFPNSVERIPVGRWNQDSNSGVFMVDGTKIPDEDAILFVSSNDPMLVAGAGTIRALNALTRNAGYYIERPELTEYFTGDLGQEPDDEELSDFLDAWKQARTNGTVGWLPGGVTRHEVTRMTAEQLQLAAAREFGIAEVSRLTGINPNWLALNVTTRTYANAQDEKRGYIEGPAAPFIHALEEKLSQNSITPNGQTVRFNLNGFLRANTLERYQAHSLAIAGGWSTPNERRALEDLPPIEGGDRLVGPSTPTPGANDA